MSKIDNYFQKTFQG